MQRLIYILLLLLGILVTDPIGAIYAGYRGDLTNMSIYTASAAIPFVGVSYVKGGKKGISKVDEMYGVIAKRANNADGFELAYKRIKDIKPEDFHVISVADAIDPAIIGAKKNANELKGLVSKELILARIKNLTEILDGLPKKLKNLTKKEQEEFIKIVEKDDRFIKYIGDNSDNLGDIVDNWRLLREAEHTRLMKDYKAIDALMKIRKNPNIKKLGITDEALAKIQGFKNASFEDVIKQLDEFATHINPNQVEGLPKLVTDLGKGGSWSQGAEWTLRYINKEATHFNGRKIVFEITDKWGDAENRMIRIADLVDITDSDNLIYYELKSVIDVPPGKFAEQFIKDLSRVDVNSLDQLKWIFDGKKAPADFKEKMIKAIDNLDIKDKKIAEKFLGKDAEIEMLKIEIKRKFDVIFDFVK